MEQNETSSAETAGNIRLLQHAASYLPRKPPTKQMEGKPPTLTAPCGTPSTTAICKHADRTLPSIGTAPETSLGKLIRKDGNTPPTHAYLETPLRGRALAICQPAALGHYTWDFPNSNLPHTSPVIRRGALQLPALATTSRHIQPPDTELHAIHNGMKDEHHPTVLAATARHNTRHGALPYHHLPALAAAAWYDQPANTALQTTHADMQADKPHAAQPHHHHLPALTAAGWHNQPYDTEMPATHAAMQADRRHAAQPHHHHLPALTAAGWHDQPYYAEMPATHADKRHAVQPHHHLPALTAQICIKCTKLDDCRSAVTRHEDS
ncbi:hypothetical protein HaLaN_26085 [Haematococcus lacustris]|uniref:Uncharacterized protein n=1 Tax=Haematococcus lacustris TaxID=44745 RepID=A0A6A0A5E1_HAELA|nr:hypothetical protein HaLaN_26085 [Haematococcus lacustris]